MEGFLFFFGSIFVMSFQSRTVQNIALPQRQSPDSVSLCVVERFALSLFFVWKITKFLNMYLIFNALPTSYIAGQTFRVNNLFCIVKNNGRIFKTTVNNCLWCLTIHCRYKTALGFFVLALLEIYCSMCHEKHFES